MFYSYDVLNIRKGKLSVAWLAATGRLNFTNKKTKHFREIMNSVIHKICDDILLYIGPVQKTTDKSKRFSLYLSSMLLCGTARLYKFQVKVLLDSVSESFSQIFTCSKILESALDASIVHRNTRTAMIDFALPPESFFFGDPRMEFDLDLDIRIIPEARNVDLTTPRKRRSRRDGGDQETIGDIQREATFRDEGEVNQLLQDWPDTTLYPNVAASIRDITMAEEPLLRPALLPEQVPELSSMYQESDFGGPSVILPPEDALKATEPPIFDAAQKEKEIEVETDKDQPPPPASTAPAVQIDDMEAIQAAPLDTSLQPTVSSSKDDIQLCLETPIQPIVKAEKPPLKKKDKEILTSKEETPAPVRPEPPRKEEDPQIVLSDIEPVMQPRAKGQRKRKLKIFMDVEEIHLQKEQIQDQLTNYADTMREKTTKDDRIDPHFWKAMKGHDDLLSRSQRVPISSKINLLISRNYVSNPRDNFYDREVSVKRQLQWQDKSVDKERRERLSAESSLGHITAPDIAESVKSYSTLSSTLFETPSIVEPPAHSESVPLQPVEEQVECAVQHDKAPDPLETPSQGFTVPHAIKRTVLFPSLEGKKPKARKRAERGEDQEEIQSPKRKKTTETTVDESSAYEILKRGEERRERLSSPDGGFQVVTVAAEVHESRVISVQPDQVPSVEEASVIQPMEEGSILQPLEPHQPEEKVEPVNLSPPVRPAISRNVMTPDTEKKQRESKLLQSLRTERVHSFESLLPDDATRRDVALTLAYLLDLHKKKRVTLEQEENYGSISVRVLKKRK